MTHARQVREIARWEFLRFFKLRDVVLTLLLVAGVSGATYGFAIWQGRSVATLEIAVISPVPVTAGEPFHLAAHDLSREAALRDAVVAQEIDGLLLVEPTGATLVVRNHPTWVAELSAAINASLATARLGELGVTPEQLAAATRPVPLTLDLTAGAHRGSARTAAFVFVGIMMLVLFFAVTCLFMAITGEKQQRAAEQLFTMASPQALIDGKLLGVTAMALVGVVQVIGVGLVLWHAFDAESLGGILDALAGVRPAELFTLVAFTMAGVAFWLALAAAVFSTISDPNSSARTNALMLPFLPLSAVFIGLGNPDSGMMQVLGIVPLTSMTVVPARMVLGEVSPAYVGLSLALLVATTWSVRRGAARIYEAAMLMYGKEASLRELLRWLRAPRARS